MDLNTEVLFRQLKKIENILSSSPSSLTPATITSSTVTDDNTVPAGNLAVTFTTSDDFTGNINGVARAASTAYVFNPTPGHTNPAIAYTTTSGSITIDIVS